MDNTKVVLFSKPIWVAYMEETEGNDIRDLVEIWGFICSDSSDATLKEYIEYLCGTSKWQRGGGEVIAGNYWISGETGNEYLTKSLFIKDYMKKAKQEMKISYRVIQTNKKLDENSYGMLDGAFITSKCLWKCLQDFGADDQKWMSKKLR